ncbi:hypothetical protein A2348_00735 [Candidatus Uhrbacteria bacterium RIFOXYB12_FULL_58_10]|nr:MAG: hypothetical protein A2348_00735 [Candidatus Uhrbacteria bacterium RIFOXYB12_FULL_58_10]
MKRDVLANYVVLLALFLLPWQTRWMYRDLMIAGDSWEYGRLSVYAVELLILLAVSLRGGLRLSPQLRSFVKPVALFLGVLLVSASFSQNISVALGALPHFAAAVALFSLIVDERTGVRRAAWAFVAGLLVPCGLAWYQVLTGISPAFSLLGLASHDAIQLGQSVVETGTGRILRGYGTLPHPNILGGYLSVSLIMLGWLSHGLKKKSSHVLIAAPVTVFASTLIITFSRSAWLAVSIGFGSLAILALAKRRALPHRVIPLITLSSFAVLVTLFVFHSAVFMRVSSLVGSGFVGQPAARLETKSIAERAGAYAQFDDVFFSNAVMGVGPGNYTVALATLFPGSPAWSYQPMHNVFFLALGEIGLILLFPAVMFFRALYRLVREHTSTAEGLFALALLAALLPIALIDHYLWSLWPGLALAAFSLALALKFKPFAHG